MIASLAMTSRSTSAIRTAESGEQLRVVLANDLVNSFAENATRTPYWP